jgi:hypothetical protein
MHRRVDERQPAGLGAGGVVAVALAVPDRRDGRQKLNTYLPSNAAMYGSAAAMLASANSAHDAPFGFRHPV